MSRPGRGRRIRRRLALVLLGGVLAILAAEAALRVADAVLRPRLIAEDARLGWRHVPLVHKTLPARYGEGKEITINRDGNRGPAWPPERDPRHHRVLVLGDSFTEGAQVDDDEVFTALLAKRHPSWEIINTGVGSYGTVQELLYLRDEGLRFRPDLVLLMVYFNDFSDNCLPYGPGMGPRPYCRVDADGVQLVEHPSLEPFLRFCAPVPGRGFWWQHSMLFRVLNEKVWARFHAGELRQVHAADLAKLQPKQMWRVERELLGRLQTLTRSAGARFGVVMIPAENAVPEPPPPLERVMTDFLRSRGVRVLSLTPAMRAATDGGHRPYWRFDIHWTPAGHRAAAAALDPFVTRLLPNDTRGR